METYSEGELQNIENVMIKFENIESVSYTHLDVYKRQLLGRGMSFVFTDVSAPSSETIVSVGNN